MFLVHIVEGARRAIFGMTFRRSVVETIGGAPKSTKARQKPGLGSKKMTS